MKTGRHVYVTGHQAVLTFHSDYSFQRRGFFVFFTTVPIGEYKYNKLKCEFLMFWSKKVSIETHASRLSDRTST